MSARKQSGRAADARAELGAEHAAADACQYLTFLSGGEIFAIGILAIKEIIEYDNLTEVPVMPLCIRGVINLRGAAVPVMDLSARLHKPPTAVTKRTCIVIVEIEEDGRHRDVGVTADAVNEVLEIPAADIEPAPDFGTGIRADLIDGMAKLDNRFVIVLNTDRVLSLDDLVTPGHFEIARSGQHAAATRE